ncbi:hypothetical protein Anapl_13968 [Anas platyrhynchos]|uniref:Uncharacterized protein n=1 Tax=Anas platyrhynchos TaxID=8839 RepID=R0KDU0_ANAPL|nr:hypothetical protein Anapl_13968 [Anas platyrhynchos]
MGKNTELSRSYTICEVFSRNSQTTAEKPLPETIILGNMNQVKSREENEKQEDSGLQNNLDSDLLCRGMQRRKGTTDFSLHISTKPQIVFGHVDAVPFLLCLLSQDALPMVICTDVLLITFHPLEFPEIIEEDNKVKVFPLQRKKGAKHTKARTVPYICKVPNTFPPQEGQGIV